MHETVRRRAAELIRRACPSKPSFDAPTVVLDTNVVMDILVFDDPAVSPIVRAIEDRRLIPLMHTETFVELVDVIGRAAFALTPEAIEARLMYWLGHVWLLEAPLPEGHYCKDLTDDKFFLLARLSNCPFLVTKDKLVLKAKKRAKRNSIAVMTIADFVGKEYEHDRSGESLCSQ